MKVFVISLLILLTAIFTGLLVNFNHKFNVFQDFKINSFKVDDLRKLLLTKFQKIDQECPTRQISMWLPKPADKIRDGNLKFVAKIAENFDYKVVNGSEVNWDVMWTVKMIKC